jgi:hypothetical protein
MTKNQKLKIIEKTATEYKQQALERRIVRGLQPQDFIAMDDEELMLFCASYASLKNSHAALVAALEKWLEFWDNMPKGQMGKLCFDVGLLNDAFIMTERVLAAAKQ